MFAILDINLIRQLSDRELKVYSVIMALSHKGNGVIRLREIQEITGKSRTQLTEIINNLIEKGFIRRLDKGKFEIEFKIEIKFEINFEGFNLRERKKILKIIQEKNLNKEQVEKILNYIKQNKAKDKVRYFAWCVKNYDKITKENETGFEEIKVFGVENFYQFQKFLNDRKIDYKFKIIEKPKQVNIGFTGGEWLFYVKGKNIKQEFQKFVKQKQNAYI